MLYGLKDCANLQILRAKDKKPILYCDYAQTSSLEFSSDAVFAHSKTTKVVRWDGNRDATFQTDMEVFDMKMVALLFGTELADKEMPIAKREVLTADATNKITLTTDKDLVDGSLSVFLLDPQDRLTHLKEQTAGDSANPDEYTINAKEITLNTTSAPEGTLVVAYYLVKDEVRSFTVDNKSFPEGYIIYGDTAIRGTDQVDKFVQFNLTNVKPQSNISLTMDVNNVCVLSITWDVMADVEGNMMHWNEIA